MGEFQEIHRGQNIQSEINLEQKNTEKNVQNLVSQEKRDLNLNLNPDDSTLGVLQSQNKQSDRQKQLKSHEIDQEIETYQNKQAKNSQQVQIPKQNYNQKQNQNQKVDYQDDSTKDLITEEKGENLDNQETFDTQNLDGQEIANSNEEVNYESSKQLNQPQNAPKNTSSQNLYGKNVVGVMEVGFVDLTADNSKFIKEEDEEVLQFSNALKNLITTMHGVNLSGTQTEQKQVILEQIQGINRELSQNVSNKSQNTDSQSLQIEEQQVNVIQQQSEGIWENEQIVEGKQTEENEVVRNLDQFQEQKQKIVQKDAVYHDASPDILGGVQIDSSIRCRTCGICEGQLDSCTNESGNLGCIYNAKDRQKKIREATKYTWAAYRQSAWGQDELLPLTNSTNTWFNLGLTLVDGLDTLLIMDLWEEYIQGRNWVQESLDLKREKVNLFETTIRIVGGLEAAFHLSGGDQLFATKAAELVLRLLPAFNSPSGIPWADAHLTELKGYPPVWANQSSLSEITTLILEFEFAAQILSRTDVAQPAMQVWSVLGKLRGKKDGLAPIYVNPVTGNFEGSRITLGARGDSYYEYMLKYYIFSGKKDVAFKNEYINSMRGVRKHLLAKTAPDPHGLWYVGELEGSDQIIPKMDHLVCFLPGLLALGHLHGVETGQAGELSDIEVAKKLMQTCYEMYRRTPTGLASEIVHFLNHHQGDYPKEHATDIGGGDFMIKPRDTHNLLRPETVESLFVMYRVTNDQIYREWGWQIFRAFEQHSKLPYGGYTNLDTVVQIPPKRRNKMESFWLAETLKYLFLLFDDDNILSLDQYVFNTEAHPLPILGSETENKFQQFYLPQIVDPSLHGQFGNAELHQQIALYQDFELRRNQVEKAVAV